MREPERPDFTNFLNRFTVPGILFLFPFLFFIDIISGKSMFNGDSPSQDFPLRYYYGLQLLRGYFPLWTFELNFGHPFFAEIHTGLLYPPNLFTALLAYTGGLRIWQLDTILHLSLAAVLFYLYGRETGLSRSTAAYYALILITSAVYLIHTGHNSYIHSLAWTGGLLFTLRRYWRLGEISTLLLFSLILLLSFNAGSPPVFFLQLVLVALYSLFLLFSRQCPDGFFSPSRVIQHGALFLLFFLLPALIQFGATYPLIENSMRNEWSRAMYFGFHSKWRSYFHLLYGNWFHYWPDPGNWEFNGYAGALAPLLAWFTFQLKWRTSVEARFWSFLFVIGVVFSQAGNFLYGWAFDHLPGFGMFRVPGRYILYCSLSLGWMAASGLDSIRVDHRKPDRWFFIRMLGLFLLLLIIPFYKNREHLPLTVTSLRQVTPDFLMLTFAILIYSILRWKGKHEKIYNGMIAAAFSLLIIGNLFWNRAVIPYRSLSVETGDAAYLRQKYPSLQESLKDNFALLGRKWSGGGYLTLETADEYNFKKSVYDGKDMPSPAQISAGAFDSGTGTGYAAYYTNRYTIETNHEAILDSLARSGDTCPLMLEKSPSLYKMTEAVCRPLMIQSTDDPNRLSIQIPAELSSGFVYLSQSYYPGWHAYDENGNALSIYQANYNFLAVQIPEGVHRVDLHQKFYFQYPLLGEMSF